MFSSKREAGAYNRGAEHSRGLFHSPKESFKFLDPEKNWNYSNPENGWIVIDPPKDHDILLPPSLLKQDKSENFQQLYLPVDFSKKIDLKQVYKFPEHPSGLGGENSEFLQRDTNKSTFMNVNPLPREMAQRPSIPICEDIPNHILGNKIVNVKNGLPVCCEENHDDKPDWRVFCSNDVDNISRTIVYCNDTLVEVKPASSIAVSQVAVEEWFTKTAHQNACCLGNRDIRFSHCFLAYSKSTPQTHILVRDVCIHIEEMVTVAFTVESLPLSVHGSNAQGMKS